MGHQYAEGTWFKHYTILNICSSHYKPNHIFINKHGIYRNSYFNKLNIYTSETLQITALQWQWQCPFTLSLRFEGMFFGGIINNKTFIDLKVSWSANFPIKYVKGYGKSSKFSEKIYLVWKYKRGKVKGGNNL